MDDFDSRYTGYKTVMEKQSDLQEMIADVEQFETLAFTAFNDEEIESLEIIGHLRKN